MLTFQSEDHLRHTRNGFDIEVDLPDLATADTTFFATPHAYVNPRMLLQEGSAACDLAHGCVANGNLLPLVDYLIENEMLAPELKVYVEKFLNGMNMLSKT